MRRRPTALLAALAAAACAHPGLPTGFARAAAEAPEGTPARLILEGDAVVGAAVALGPTALPAAVRLAAEAIAPGGDAEFTGREWGPRGDGYRIEKRYDEGQQHAFRSLLVRADGVVLERSHSVGVAKAPAAIVGTAMRIGREVLRCEIVSGSASEEGWRVLVRDGAGRSHVVELDLDGRLLSRRRLVQAQLLAP
jgi:hypothetical protein